MSELVSNYPSRQTRLVQPCRRRLPKAVRGDPVEARAVKRRSNVTTGVLRVAQTTERIGEHRILKPHSSCPPSLQVGHSPGGRNVSHACRPSIRTLPTWLRWRWSCVEQTRRETRRRRARYGGGLP